MHKLVAAAVVLAWAHAAAADDLPARIDAAVAAVMADAPSAGLAVEVAWKGQPVFKKGYGKANVELNVPMTERNLFRIGSITKQFTAAAIMRLVEAGKLKLDDDVGKLVPEAPLHGKHVTVAHLLTHTSGIKSYTQLPEAVQPLPLPPPRLYALLKDQPFDFEPGRSWRYSNTNYYLLGVIIEKVARQRYRDFLRVEVLNRAGLKRTMYCDNEPILPGRAQGYSADGPRLKNAAPIDMSAPFAAGALCSTVEDLVAWAQALAGGKVVSPASYARMTTPVKTGDGKESHYGFGLGIGVEGGHHVVSHAGGINGFSSMLSNFPDDGVTIAVLANTDGGTAELAMLRVAEIVLGLPAPPPPRIVPLPDPTKYAGVFRGNNAGALHVMRVYVEAGRLWLHDDFDGGTDRLDYQGGDDFAVPHSATKVRISGDALDVTLPGEPPLHATRDKK